MKKHYLITLLMAVAISMISNVSFAQFYGNVNLGYGLGKSTMNIGDFSNYTYLSPTSFKDEQIYLSLGKGFNFGVTAGDMFNKNVGAEIGINYLLGGKCTAEDKYENGTGEYSLKAGMLRIIPAAKVSAGFEKINPYAKFGAVISFGTVKHEMKQTLGSITTTDIWCYKGGVAFGFMGALGVDYSINERIALFAELNTINQSYSPKKGELTEATYNGEDQLPDMTTSQKEIEFVDEVTTAYEGGDQSDSEPTKVLKQKFPLGSVGINFGLEIRF